MFGEFESSSKITTRRDVAGLKEGKPKPSKSSSAIMTIGATVSTVTKPTPKGTKTVGGVVKRFKE